jgi:site-specific DNA-methyltransferase (adenine-specific)
MTHIAQEKWPSNSSRLLGTPVFQDKNRRATLYHADCLEFMDALIDRCSDGLFDLIFADPPYFLSNGGITCQAGRMVSVNKGTWDRSSGPEKDHAFNLDWLTKCQKLLKPNGTIWVSGTHHAIHSVGFAMQILGYKILNEIVWEKPNPPPNLSCRYFTHSTETIIWASKNSRSRHVFNYDIMRSENEGKQMKSVWKISAANQREKLCGRHPTQKPVELLDRIIRAASLENDLVFDPFSGSSTTGIAALAAGRRFVGAEIEEKYIDLSMSRLSMAL